VTTKKEEEAAYLEGKARGFEEGYAKSVDILQARLFIVVSLVLSYVLYRLTGCS